MTFLVHVGGHKIQRHELLSVDTPPATNTFVPVPHAFLVDNLLEQLARADFEVTAEQHALAKKGAQYFGFFEIARAVANGLGYSAMLGLRNAHDRSLAVGLVGGSRVFVCDNLAFSGAISIMRKHTTNVRDDIDVGMYKAMKDLKALFNDQDDRFTRYADTELNDRDADHIAVKLLRSNAVPVRQFPKLIEQWHKPDHAEHTQGGKTAWRLFNAATEALKSEAEGALITLPRRTQTVQDVIDSVIGYRSVRVIDVQAEVIDDDPQMDIEEQIAREAA